MHLPAEGGWATTRYHLQDDIHSAHLFMERQGIKPQRVGIQRFDKRNLYCRISKKPSGTWVRKCSISTTGWRHCILLSLCNTNGQTIESGAVLSIKVKKKAQRGTINYQSGITTLLSQPWPDRNRDHRRLHYDTGARVQEMMNNLENIRIKTLPSNS